VKKLDTSGITAHEGGYTADGAEAVDVVRCLHLQSAMALNIRTGMLPTRGVTKTKMRDMANAYSGSKAKNIVQALHDLVIWFEAATDKPVTNPLVLEAAGLTRLEGEK
jgi:hypothetical protein